MNGCVVGTDADGRVTVWVFRATPLKLSGILFRVNLSAIFRASEMDRETLSVHLSVSLLLFQKRRSLVDSICRLALNLQRQQISFVGFAQPA